MEDLYDALNVNSTCKEIMNDPYVRDHIGMFFPDFMLRLVPEKLRNAPLSGIGEKVRMPWGAPFPAEMFLHAAELVRRCRTDRLYEFIPLWKSEEEMAAVMASDPPFMPGKADEGKAAACLISTNTTTEALRPAAIVCPGGGYTLLSVMAEGLRFAKELEKNGIRPFILLYRLMPERYPAPQLDLARAVRYVRTHADELGIVPDDLMIMGSSAGGQLAATYAGNASYYTRLAAAEAGADPEPDPGYDPVPEKLCLNYPVITIDGAVTVTPEEIGTPADLSEICRELLSVKTDVSAGYPKTFVWACDDDPMVHADNARGLHLALEKAGAEHMYCRFPDGGHGIGMGEGTSAEGWFGRMLDYFYPERNDPEGYFARHITDGTWMIGCDYTDFGGRCGKEIEFGMPTGNSWMIVGKDRALLVDTAADRPGIRAFAERIAGVPVELILSHAHFDHVYRLKEFSSVMIHPDDIGLLKGAYAEIGWAPCPDIPETVMTVEDGQVLDIGNGHRIRVIHFPCHTDGSILLYDEKTKYLISGDSIGRRLIFSSCGYVPFSRFDRQLAAIQKMDITGICSCHDRRIIDKGQIQFMRDSLPLLLDTDKTVSYGNTGPMHFISVGNEKRMRFFDSSYMQHQEQNILMERKERSGQDHTVL